MGFDEIISEAYPDGTALEFGIINGNNSIVIIKSGAGGSFHGYEDKYLKTAQMLNDIYGCTVLCTSNIDKASFEKYDAKVIQNIISKINDNPKLYYIGFSNGAVQGIMTAAKHFDFAHFLLINMPLMINFHKIMRDMEQISSKMTFIYGEKDPSYSYIPLLENRINDNSIIEVISNADHQFRGMTDEFIALAKKLFD